MLSSHSEGAQDGLRRGHKGRAVPETQAEAEQEMPVAVKRARVRD